MISSVRFCRTSTISPLHTNLQVANFQRWDCAPGSSNEWEPVLSTSGLSDTTARPLSPAADDPAALPSPTSSSQSLFLPVCGCDISEAGRLTATSLWVIAAWCPGVRSTRVPGSHPEALAGPVSLSAEPGGKCEMRVSVYSVSVHAWVCVCPVHCTHGYHVAETELILVFGETAAAAAKSLQSCPTLCDPIHSSPPGSPVPGILQARTLEWVAISFSNAGKWKVKVKLLSRVWLLATPWTASH